MKHPGKPKHGHRLLWLLMAVVAALALVALACDDDDEEEPTVTEATPTPAAATATPVEVAVAPEFGEWGGVIIPEGECAVIGLSKVISGTLLALGVGGNVAARLGAIDLETGEPRAIQGFCIDFVEADDLCNAEGGLAAAEILIGTPNLIGVQGSICSGVNVAVEPRYEEAHITQVSGGSTAFVVTHPEGRAPFETFLRTTAIDPTQGDRQAAFAIDELGATTAFVTFDTDAYGFGLQGNFVEGFEARGGTIVGEAQGWEKGTVEFSALVTSVIAEDPDVVYTAGFDPEAAAFVSQLRDAGYEGPYIAGDGVFTAQFIELGGEATEGAYLTAPRAAESPALDLFKKVYRETHPDGEEWDYVPFNPQYHDATLAFILAAQEVAVVFEGDLYVDLLDLNKALHGLSYDGVSYHIEFDANGDVKFAEEDLPIGFYQVKNGEYEYVTNK